MNGELVMETREEEVDENNTDQDEKEERLIEQQRKALRTSRMNVPEWSPKTSGMKMEKQGQRGGVSTMYNTMSFFYLVLWTLLLSGIIQ